MAPVISTTPAPAAAPSAAAATAVIQDKKTSPDKAAGLLAPAIARIEQAGKARGDQTQQQRNNDIARAEKIMKQIMDGRVAALNRQQEEARAQARDMRGDMALLNRNQSELTAKIEDQRKELDCSIVIYTL